MSYYRARFYSPELGRFLQTDPIEYYDSSNLYQYVHNNPVNGVDPWGLYDINFWEMEGVLFLPEEPYIPSKLYSDGCENYDKKKKGYGEWKFSWEDIVNFIDDTFDPSEVYAGETWQEKMKNKDNIIRMGEKEDMYYPDNVRDPIDATRLDELIFNVVKEGVDTAGGKGKANKIVNAIEDWTSLIPTSKDVVKKLFKFFMRPTEVE